MNLDANYLRSLNYKEVNLKDIEIVSLVSDDDDDENGCGIGIKGDKPMTEAALKQLCSHLRIPYAFTRQLRENGRSHILSYIQRQLSQVANSSVIVVSGEKNILSIADEEKLHYQGKDALIFDARLKEIIASPTSPFELANTYFVDGDITYSLLYRDPQSMEADKAENEGTKDLRSLWRWGFTINHSVLGMQIPSIGAQLLRLVCTNLTYLPAKSYTYPMPFESEFEDRWQHISDFLSSPPPPAWMTLNNMITKLSRTTASFREVAETRKKLLKLKCDKEDTETAERINAALQWKRIQKAYGIKDMAEKPPKSWYAKAGTPLTLFQVYNACTQEATHAPSNIDVALRQNILIYAGGVLVGSPDLFMQPQQIDWTVN